MPTDAILYTVCTDCGLARNYLGEVIMLSEAELTAAMLCEGLHRKCWRHAKPFAFYAKEVQFGSDFGKTLSVLRNVTVSFGGNATVGDIVHE